MLRILIAIGLLSLLLTEGCHAPSTMDQLRAGSEKVCVADDVRRTLKTLIVPNPLSLNIEGALLADRQAALDSVDLDFDLTTLASFDKAVSRATCNSTLKISGTDAATSEFAISYDISPSAEQPEEFIVSSHAGEPKQAILSMVVAKLTAIVDARKEQQRLDVLNKTVSAKWLIGGWRLVDSVTASGADCAANSLLLQEYTRDGRFVLYDGHGTWSLKGFVVTVRGENEGVPFSREATITEASDQSFNSTEISGQTSSYKRCHNGTSTAPLLAASATVLSDGAAQAVRTFYGALSDGDGDTASSVVVPEKRSVPALSSTELTAYWGQMTTPLRLLSVTATSPDHFRVHYAYAGPQRSCDGHADVATTYRNGEYFIQGIRALNGC